MPWRPQAKTAPVPRSISVGFPALKPISPATSSIAANRDTSGPAAAWQRISPAQPVVGPGYHDPNVQPGHTYIYAVTAIDQSGHESARSNEASDTVPAP